MRSIKLVPIDRQERSNKTLALPTNLDDIRRLKSYADYCAWDLRGQHGVESGLCANDPVAKAELHFLMKNPDVVPRSDYVWSATNSDLVPPNKTDLHRISKVLEDDPDLVERPPGTLQSLIDDSEEQQKLNELVRSDLVFPGKFRILYGPQWVSGDFELRLVGKAGISSLGMPYKLRFQVKRAVHCLIVAEPDTEAVIVETPVNFKTTVRAYEVSGAHGLRWEVRDHGQPFELRGVEDLLDMYAQGSVGE